jgi:S-formylglutathione hydrolase
MVEIKQLSKSKCFNGYVAKYSYFSDLLKSETKFNIFFPPLYDQSGKNPVIYFLSGLTCNEDNFITKSGAVQSASEHGIVLICPDTSPRNLSIPGDSDYWDFGVGAGFYVDSTNDPYKNYQMYSFITSELKSLVESEFRIDGSRSSIMGHSMGGHGSLIIGLKNPNAYRSISAFSPIGNFVMVIIVHPTICPWGIKAFSGYLGSNKEMWKQYDTFELSKQYSGPKKTILVDVGSNDSFKDQLNVDLLNQVGNPLLDFNVRVQPDYDHSYWFISTFIRDHIQWHASFLNET